MVAKKQRHQQLKAIGAVNVAITNNNLILKRKGENTMRRDMITRTVIGTEVDVKVVNTATDAITFEKVKLNKAFTDIADKKLMNAVKKALTTDVVVIKIEAITPMNKLYGLDTSKFMEQAIELDPKTRKPLAQTEEEGIEDDFEDEDEEEDTL